MAVKKRKPIIPGKLTDAQEDALVQAYCEKSDIGSLALTTGLPEKVVRRALNTPSVSAKCRAAKRASIGAELWGRLMDTLSFIALEDPDATASQKLMAIKLLREEAGVGIPEHAEDETEVALSYEEQVLALVTR